MKITEITEGWGEYSNKSNHRMNKFKRQETDEGWGEFKSAVQRGTDAVVGAAGRQWGDVKNTAMAKLGSKKALGKQQMQRVVGGVVNNFNRYLGQTGAKATLTTLKDYLTKLGFQNPVMMENFPPGYDPMKQGGQKGAPTKELSRNDLFAIIGKNIQQAMASGTLPKEVKKFLGQ